MSTAERAACWAFLLLALVAGIYSAAALSGLAPVAPWSPAA